MTNPVAGALPNESPDCTTCRGHGSLTALGPDGFREDCPDCDPTAEQAGATTAEYQRWVAAGMPDLHIDPF